MTDGNEGYTSLLLTDRQGRYNPTAAVVTRMLGRVRTIMWAQVVAVDAPPETNAPVTVQVQPLVGMSDSQGNNFPHGIISAIPAVRLMSGNGAVIADPVAGDVGFLFVCDRDSSSAQQNLAPSAAPTARMHDMADGVFWGGWGNDAPTNFIKFNSDGTMEWQDGVGNQMFTGVGFVNFITPALQVNGVPISVP